MIRWSYAINQFKPQFDDFTRRRDHLRALRVISISGFSGVELSSGTGRWEALGNPAQIAANFGSVAGFGEFVREAALEAVSSWFWDPLLAMREDLLPATDPADAGSRDLLIERARWYASALAELGGDVLVARPTASAWVAGALDDSTVGAIAESWNAVGAAISQYGIRLGLHFDFLSSLRLDDGLERLVAATDPAHVGFAVDTAEFAVAGLDPIAFLAAHPERIAIVHLKNAGAVDGDDEYLVRSAEQHVRKAGGRRAVPRWFLELGVAPRLVDATAVVQTLARSGYDGWIVVESDMSPHPATSTMLNGWEVQHVLRPALETREAPR